MDIFTTNYRESPHQNIKEYMKRALSSSNSELEWIYGSHPRKTLSKIEFLRVLNKLRQEYKNNNTSNTNTSNNMNNTVNNIQQVINKYKNNDSRKGFLPKKKGRKTKFEFLNTLPCTIVIFESPRRVLKTLSNIKEYMGDERIISIHREMTKMYEEVFLGTIPESIDYFSNKKPKGEFVLVLAREGYKL